MRLVVNALAFTVITCLFNNAYAGETEQQQIQELRNEIEALKTAIQKQSNTETLTATTSQIQTGLTPVVDVTKKTDSSALKWKSKNEAELNIYGFVRTDAAYQVEGAKSIFNGINTVALQDDPNKKLTEDRFDATLTTTRIGLDFKAPIQEADVGGKIEIDFRGGTDKDTVRLRHVYMTYNNWLVGQTTSNFLSTETTPEMLDFNGALGSGTYRTPMVRFTDNFSKNTKYFIGIEKSNEQNRLPTATAKISHKFAEGAGVITGRGMVQEVRARDFNDETAIGWGLGIGTRYEMDKIILSANYSHASGDNKYLLYNANNYFMKNDDLDLVEFDTFNIGATYKFNSKLRSTLAYSAMHYTDNVLGGNDHLQQGWLNVLYNPVKPITFGMEYVYGERETVEGRIGNDNRIEIMAKYDF